MEVKKTNIIEGIITESKIKQNFISVKTITIKKEKTTI
jgi:hypothetical protein